jgi:hypothetical protein
VRVAEAVEYFEHHIQRHDARGMDRGFTLDEIVARGEAFHERMMLHSVGEPMRALVEHMRAAGVDEDIIAFLRPSIEEQMRRLDALGENT